MKDNDFKLLRGFNYGVTDIFECRVAFATENSNIGRQERTFSCVTRVTFVIEILPR